MQLIALIIYIIFLAVYVFLIFSINSQVKKYLLPNDFKNKKILSLFLIGSFILILISIIMFFLVGWNNFSFDLNSLNILNF